MASQPPPPPKPWETRRIPGTGPGPGPAPLSSECAIFSSRKFCGPQRGLGRRRLRALFGAGRPLPLSTSSHPYPSRVEVQPGRLQGSFRCQTAVSDSAALDSDVSRGSIRLCGCGCSEARGRYLSLFSVPSL